MAPLPLQTFVLPILSVSGEELSVDTVDACLIERISLYLPCLFFIPYLRKRGGDNLLSYLVNEYLDIDKRPTQFEGK